MARLFEKLHEERDMLRLAALAFIGCLMGTAVTAEQYVCIPEQATGFIKKEGKWELSSFTTPQKYLVTLEKAVRMSVTQFGESEAVHDDSECNTGEGGGWCADLWGQFIIDLDTFRYTRSFIIGYVNDGDETPLVEIGLCSKL